MVVPSPQLSAPQRGSWERGIPRCARNSIGNFATLVRKSYSSSLKRISTLIRVRAFLAFTQSWEGPVVIIGPPIFF
jgi:hypothetical protein